MPTKLKEEVCGGAPIRIELLNTGFLVSSVSPQTLKSLGWVLPGFCAIFVFAALWTSVQASTAIFAASVVFWVVSLIVGAIFCVSIGNGVTYAISGTGFTIWIRSHGGSDFLVVRKYLFGSINTKTISDGDIESVALEQPNNFVERLGYSEKRRFRLRYFLKSGGTWSHFVNPCLFGVETSPDPSKTTARLLCAVEDRLGKSRIKNYDFWSAVMVELDRESRG